MDLILVLFVFESYWPPIDGKVVVKYGVEQIFLSTLDVPTLILQDKMYHVVRSGADLPRVEVRHWIELLLLLVVVVGRE